MVKYIVVEDSSLYDFKRKIQQKIEEGCVLQGGIAVTMNSSYPHFYQSLTKEESAGEKVWNNLKGESE